MDNAWRYFVVTIVSIIIQYFIFESIEHHNIFRAICLLIVGVLINSIIIFGAKKTKTV